MQWLTKAWNTLKLDKDFFTSNAFLHSVKTAVACLLGIGVCSFVHVYNVLWLVLTILVVMGAQVHFGSAIQKSYFRMTGTIVGAAIASLTLILTPHNPYIILIVIFITVFSFSYVANTKSEVKEAGILGAITTVTILISQNPSLSYALFRVLEIIGGILIALAVSKFFFPMHARLKLVNNFASVLRQCCDIYKTAYESTPLEEKATKLQSLEEKVIKTLAEQRTVIKDAKNEISSIRYNKSIAESMINYQHRLFRSTTFMYQVVNKEPDKFQRITSVPKLDRFNEAVVNILSLLADAIEDKHTLTGLEPLKIALEDLNKVIIKFHENNTSENEIELHIDALLFCARHIVDEISVLQMLVGAYRTLS